MRRIARSLSAAIVIVLAVLGVPIALWWLAAPRFAELLVGGSVGEVLLRPDDGTLLLSVLALGAGVAWLILTWSILTELTAACLRRPAHRVPVPGFRLAGVVAAALVAALLGSSPALADTTQEVRGPTTSQVDEDGSLTATPQSTQGPPYVVGPRDSLWRIADNRLGNGLRWREIFELNVGRPQADGGRLTDGGSLTPGWLLYLPADATREVVVEPGDTLTGLAAEQLGGADRFGELFELNKDVPQADGETLTSPGRIHPGWKLTLPEPGATPPPAGSRTADPVQPTPPMTSSPSAESPVRTGTPPGPAVPNVTPTVQPSPSTTVAASGPRSSSANTPSSPVSWMWVPAIGITAAAAGGVLAVLARRRRSQQRHRPHGHRIAVPDDEAGRFEWAASRHGRSEPADRLDLALRSLVHPDGRPDPAPHIDYIVRNDETAWIELTDSVPLPPPFRPSNGGRTTWTVECDATLPVSDDEVAGYGSPYPVLVTLAVDDDRTLLVDIEQHRMLRIGGDGALVQALLLHIAAELAANEAAEDVEVLLVGLGEECEALNPDRIRAQPDLATAISDLERRAIATRMELSRCALPSTIDGRLQQNSSTSWLPTVLLVGVAPAEDEHQRLDQLLDEATAGTTGVAVVVFAPESPDIRVGDDGCLSPTVPANGDWRAVQLRTEDSNHLTDLLGSADDPAVPVGPADGDDSWSSGMNEDGSLSAAGADVDDDTDRPPSGPRGVALHSGQDEQESADPESLRRLAIVDHQDPGLDDDLAAWRADGNPVVPMIAILGDPEVRGAGERPNTRPSWFAEVLVYLSLHPAGVTQAKAATDLWPDGHRISPATIRHAFYGARRWAGRGFGGDPGATFVSDLQNDNSYRLRGHLLDWDLFRRLRKRAQARHTARHRGATDDYLAALDLIRGPVLGSLRPGGYAWLNNHDQRHDLQIPGFVVDTAHELVEIALASGDLDLARRAAERARTVDVDVAFDRPLTDLMRIAHAEDNRAELELYGSILLDARGFDVPEELAPESFTILNELLPSGPRRPRS